MKLKILSQPDDTTCGPTSLHAVYNYLGLEVGLQTLISDIQSLEEGGTLAVLLGLDALKRGFKAEVYTYNLKIFDPSWRNLSSLELIDKLERQLEYKHGKKFRIASEGYINFLKRGGRLHFENLSMNTITNYLSREIPVLAGLSATYLYECKREFEQTSGKIMYDDIRGEPTGHFVVLRGITKNNQIRVADPYLQNPISGDNYYELDPDRLINAIMLGILTYDANLLIITKK